LRSHDLSLERAQKLEGIGFPGPKPKRGKRKRAEQEEVGDGSAKRPALAEQEPSAVNEL